MKTCIICGLSDTSLSKRQSEVEGVCEEVILHLHLVGDGAMKDTGMVVPNLIQKLLLTDDSFLFFSPRLFSLSSKLMGCTIVNCCLWKKN